MASGPRFVRFFWPVLQALRDLGGSARPREVVDLVIEMLNIPDDERAERMKSGSLRVDNQVHWARNYLVWAGLLDGSKRGWWQLSNSGWALPLEHQNPQTAYQLFKQVRAEPGVPGGDLCARGFGADRAYRPFRAATTVVEMGRLPDSDAPC